MSHIAGVSVRGQKSIATEVTGSNLGEYKKFAYRI